MARQRAPRLLREPARAICSHVLARFACAPAERKQLLQCWAAVLDESLQEPMEWLEEIENGRISAREALRWRARALRNRIADPHCLSQNWEMQAAELRKAWDSVARASRCKHWQSAATDLHVAPPFSPGGGPNRAPRAGRRSAAPAIGRVDCRFSDAPIPQTPREAWIPQWVPPEVERSQRLADTLPTRSVAHAATDSQQRRQQATVASWRLERLTREERRGVFAHGKLAAAVRRWRATRRDGRELLPPLDVLRRWIYTEVAPTPLCSTGGHLWAAADGLPLDESQLAALMGIPEVWRGRIAQLPAGSSPAKVRRLLGSSVHWGSAEMVLRRGLQRLRRQPKSFAALGAGLDLLGAALWEASERRLKYAWYAEALEEAAAAHDVIWAAVGAHPRRVLRAEDTSRLRLPRADVELVTLRCAPFSPANRRFPAGVWAAVAELRATMAGVFARRPLMIVYENSAGLLRAAWMRAAVESALSGDAGYEWELVVACPELQQGACCRRRRAFYIGVLKSAC